MDPSTLYELVASGDLSQAKVAARAGMSEKQVESNMKAVIP